MICPLFGAHRRCQTRPSARGARCRGRRRGRRAAPRRRHRACAARSDRRSGSIRIDGRAGPVLAARAGSAACSARSNCSGLQWPSSAQQVPPATSAPEARQALRQRRAIEHLDVAALEARLRQQRRDALRRARRVPARDRHTCMPPGWRSATSMPVCSRSIGGKPRPLARRALRPRAVGWHAEPLALHPDQAEVAARRAMRDVAFVEDDESVGRARACRTRSRRRPVRRRRSPCRIPPSSRCERPAGDCRRRRTAGWPGSARRSPDSCDRRRRCTYWHAPA